MSPRATKRRASAKTPLPRAKKATTERKPEEVPVLPSPVEDKVPEAAVAAASMHPRTAKRRASAKKPLSRAKKDTTEPKPIPLSVIEENKVSEPEGPSSPFEDKVPEAAVASMPPRAAKRRASAKKPSPRAKKATTEPKPIPLSVIEENKVSESEVPSSPFEDKVPEPAAASMPPRVAKRRALAKKPSPRAKKTTTETKPVPTSVTEENKVSESEFPSSPVEDMVPETAAASMPPRVAKRRALAKKPSRRAKEATTELKPIPTSVIEGNKDSESEVPSSPVEAKVLEAGAASMPPRASKRRASAKKTSPRAKKATAESKPEEVPLSVIEENKVSESEVPSSSKQKKTVHFNALGQPIGEGSTAFNNYLGMTTRTHCPIFYGQCRDVPDQIKEMIWKSVTDEYFIDPAYKKRIFERISKHLRDYKFELRHKHYDKYDTNEERKRNCPRGVEQEDWDRFVDNQSTSTMQAHQGKGKSVREAMKTPRATGRRGSARLAEDLKKGDHIATITRTDEYQATHSCSDGSFRTLPKLSNKMKQIKAIAERDPSNACLDIDHDPVAQVCSPEGKGHVQSMGTSVSRTVLSFSAPAKDQLQQETRKRLYFEERVTAQGQVIMELNEQIATFGQVVMDLKEQIACQGSHRPFSTNSTTSHIQSPPLAESQVVPSPRRAQHCELLDFGDVVVATGMALRGGSLGDGGNQPPTDVYNVIIDVVHDPNAPLLRPDVSFSTLGDVELGTIIKWPKHFTRLLS